MGESAPLIKLETNCRDGALPIQRAADCVGLNECSICTIDWKCCATLCLTDSFIR
jgi:hypothetical protein